jgi:hypothetical protein
MEFGMDIPAIERICIKPPKQPERKMCIKCRESKPIAEYGKEECDSSSFRMIFSTCRRCRAEINTGTGPEMYNR